MVSMGVSLGTVLIDNINVVSIILYDNREIYIERIKYAL